MTQERNDKSKYKSLNSGEFCTAEQYIAEIIVTRKYEKKNVKLPFKFWNLAKYKKEYLYNIFAANKLTKVYDADIVIKVLNTTGKYITYIHAGEIFNLLDTEVEKQNNEVQDYKLEINDVNSAPKTFSKQTSLGKLRE